jgi:hypothetical protein
MQPVTAIRHHDAGFRQSILAAEHHFGRLAPREAKTYRLMRLALAVEGNSAAGDRDIDYIPPPDACGMKTDGMVGGARPACVLAIQDATEGLGVFPKALHEDDFFGGEDAHVLSGSHAGSDQKK